MVAPSGAGRTPFRRSSRGTRAGFRRREPNSSTSRLASFSFMLVARCHILSIARQCTTSHGRMMSVVSSANWEILWAVAPAFTPSMSGLSFMSLASGSAMIRKSRGLRGHPWATPELRAKGAPRYPFTYIWRWGGVSSEYARETNLIKSAPNPIASSPSFMKRQEHLSNAFSISMNR